MLNLIFVENLPHLTKHEFIDRYRRFEKVTDLVEAIEKKDGAIHLSGLAGSSLSFVLAAAYKSLELPFVLICNDKEEAAYYLNDLEQFLAPEGKTNRQDVLFFPGSYRRPYQIEDTDNANILLRAEVLNRISSQKKPAVIVTYPDALFEQVVTRRELKRNTLKISQGEKVSLDFVHDVLHEYKFNRVDFVVEPGDFAIRGGIIDVFSFSNEQPYRIEFFGDEVDSIRSFDIESQLSVDRLNRIDIMPNLENKKLEEKRQVFLEYIPAKSVIFTFNTALMAQRLDKLYEKATEAFAQLKGELSQLEPSELFCDGKTFLEKLSQFQVSKINEPGASPESVLRFDTLPQPSFNKQFDLLIANLRENDDQGYSNYIFCDNESQARRFHDIFDDMDEEVPYKTITLPIYSGFIDRDLKIACYTDHQIFERYHKFKLKSGFAKKQSIKLKELTQLEQGDYVTHIDHGIGRYGGLHKIEVEGKKQEAIKLIYGDRDVLYISIHALHKISKYNGKDGKPPKVHKLGSNTWKKLKQKTKARVKHIAFSLIELYAKRKLKKGLSYGPDTFMQHELEASFIYEDTPDQLSATEAVKVDMEKDQPMDRLICGDVGFGKTEIAIRAAFKAVDNGKQVAVLVPTTILAFQHAKTFRERLRDFPVRVEYLNRFRTTKQRRDVLEGLADGQVDIVIGTHQLVNKNVKFKDLGLLVIDEEQKFGVAVKEKLKTLKENIDTLTLTATPIPRTLQFSLMAARDLSVIKTPPPNRHPIETQVVGFNEETIRDAIRYEIQRGGQVFFIHNRIENIREVAGMLQRLLPDARIGIGHGQMDGKKLEELMLEFINGEFDVLVSTTIVESGLDVPNANTIFINNANNFGLSDLHQMRGRVGRSNKKAFCYLITPPYHVMTEDARKRIQALEMHSELGSGFYIAMKDLEIRGAGDLLGAEQSGFINDIGFETYQKILNEAIEELKENEFKELYADQDTGKKEYVKEVQIDSDFEILFPDDYVSSISERLSLYKELSDFTEEEELRAFEEQLIDRFGELPVQAHDLLDSVRIKWIAKELGLERLVMKQKRMIGYFISDQQSEYFQSETFSRVLAYIQKNGQTCVMKERETKKGLRLLITFIRIDSVSKALATLRSI